jgi:hypothetical protein
LRTERDVKNVITWERYERRGEREPRRRRENARVTIRAEERRIC